MTDTPDLKSLAEGLTNAHSDFLRRVCDGLPLTIADRPEDRVRQFMRRKGFVKIVKQPRRWVATPEGQRLRDHLLSQGYERGER